MQCERTHVFPDEKVVFANSIKWSRIIFLKAAFKKKVILEAVNRVCKHTRSTINWLAPLLFVAIQYRVS